MPAILVIALLAMVTAVASATDFYVAMTGNDTTGNGSSVKPWRTIQYAVYNASVLPGDTIIVRDGTYTENVNVNKKLTIRSENSSTSTTVSAANPNDNVFHVTADYVNITGFTIRDSGNKMYGGIFPDSVNYCRISDNTITNNDGAIRPQTSYSMTFTNNIVTANEFGLYLAGGGNHIITNNTISYNQAPFQLYGSKNNIIINNTITANIGTGIFLSSTSTNNTIYNNYFNNTNNARDYSNGKNTWNTIKTAGTNIVGGPNLGGNFWAKPDGTGWSQTCTDTYGDGICDSSYSFGSGNVDYLPLAIWSANPTPSIISWYNSKTPMLSPPSVLSLFPCHI